MAKDKYYPPYSSEEKTDDFVHLHNHTDYSLLDGAAPISEYIRKAREYKMKALAITDHGNMYGALFFYNACKAANIKPIIGCEFYVNPKGRKIKVPYSEGGRHYHLILLAMNDKGYHNLMELNSIANLEGFYVRPRIDEELIEKYSDNLICLSACLAGELLQILLNKNHEYTEEQCYNLAKDKALYYKNIFKDRYFIELQDHGLKEQRLTNPILVKIAHELDIPLVCTNDIHYIESSDADIHDTVLCMSTGAKKNEKDRMRFDTEEFYFKSGDEMRELFDWIPEAYKNTKKIADMVNLEIKFPGALLPEYEIPSNFKNISEYITWLSYEGCKERYNEITPELKARLDHELDIIIGMHFEGYFLIVRDYIYWAKTHNIAVGPGRGSGAGSLVAYCINITDVDPIKFDLIFERFLNPERVSMPDFDIDFDPKEVDRVIQYVTDKYGAERVCRICTITQLKPKSAVKDVARVYDIPFSEAKSIVDLIDGDTNTLAEAFENEPKLKELEDRGGVYTDIFRTARRIEGLNKTTGIHPAGVVIGKTKISDYVPLKFDNKNMIVASQYTKDVIEECGLVKMDFLSIKTLTLINDTLELIHKKYPDFDINKIDYEDKKTFDMLKAGDSDMVFQFESSGMKGMLKEAQPDNIEELVALIALYRPGPIDFIPTYIARKKGKQKINYDDPALIPILKNTYGICVYQEQVMQVAQAIAGYTLGEADNLRRIMGKKKVEEIASQREKFIAGAKNLGRSEALAKKIFSFLEPFALYGFNKSHAVAYTYVSYQTAYLKAHFPIEFMAANLTNEMTNPDAFKEYLGLAKSLGISVLPPNINESGKYFSVSNGNIIYGIAGIKGIGEGFCKIITDEREKNGPYKSFIDFVQRQDDHVLNIKSLGALINAGVFDIFGIDRATLNGNINEVLSFDKSNRAIIENGQMSLFANDDVLDTYVMKPCKPYTKEEMLNMEKELLGFYVSGHPLDEFDNEIKRCVWVNISKPNELPKNRNVSLVAQITELKVIKTKKNDNMAILTLADKNGSIGAVMFPDFYDENIKKDFIYGFNGYFEKKKDTSEIQFIIESICKPDELKPYSISSIYIEIDADKFRDDIDFVSLKEYIINHPGNLPVYAYLKGNKKVFTKFGSDFTVGFNNNIKKDLMDIDYVNNVLFA